MDVDDMYSEPYVSNVVCKIVDQTLSIIRYFSSGWTGLLGLYYRTHHFLTGICASLEWPNFKETRGTRTFSFSFNFRIPTVTLTFKEEHRIWYNDTIRKWGSALPAAALFSYAHCIRARGDWGHCFPCFKINEKRCIFNAFFVIRENEKNIRWVGNPL